MKKRLHLLIAVIVLCLMIPASSVCASAKSASGTPIGTIVSAPETVTSSDVLTDPAYLIYRSYLEENSEVAQALYDGLLAHQSRIDVSCFRIPASHIRALMHLMTYSFPELLCMNGYSYTRSALDSTVLSISPTYSVEDPQEKRSLFYEIASSRYLSLIDEDMDDFTKAVILHDALAINAHYADEDKMRLSDNVTFMADGWGVCHQYTQCYAYLLGQCGIKSEIVQSSSMNHAWIKVLLDGSYYNVDLTWDDPRPDKAGKVSHQYFLYSDSAFRTADTATKRKSHDGYYTIHPSTSDKYDRFVNLHSISTQLCYLNGAFFGITSDGRLVRYDHLTDEITVLSLLPYRWPAGENMSWIGNYSSLVPFNEKLYYNSPDEIYQYDPEKNKTELFAENDGDEKLYGLRLVDNQLWVVRADSPNEGFIAPTYLKDLPVPHDTLKIGNVDGDDSVTIFDATAIQRWLAQLSTPVFNKDAADCDGDGDVTIIDATAIQRWLAGLPTSGRISESPT